MRTLYSVIVYIVLVSLFGFMLLVSANKEVVVRDNITQAWIKEFSPAEH